MNKLQKLLKKQSKIEKKVK